MSKHAFLSASGAPAWSRCAAKPWREKGLPDETNIYAEEGTKAHELLELAIISKQPAYMFNDYPVDMQYEIQKVLDYIVEQQFGELYSERSLDISFITTEPGATGTADLIGLKGDTLTVADLKYGMGRVEAEGNEQLLIYGVAALEEFDLTGDIKNLQLVILQPRLDSTSEWLLTIDQAKELIEGLRVKAKRILTAEGGDPLSATPGDKQCRFCKLKASCPEYRQQTVMIVTDTPELFEKDDFLGRIKTAESQIVRADDIKLSNYMDAVELIENWCVGVRNEVAKRLHDDNFSDHRYKLVQGRAGHRKFGDVNDVIEIAEEHGIKEEQLYEKEILSPAKMEKLHKKQNPVFWAKVALLMNRTDGTPIVVPASDKRPALNLALDFKPIEDDYIEAAIGLTVESKK